MNGGETRVQIAQVVRCPVCQQEFRLVDVLDNYFVRDGPEQQPSATESTSQVCTSCEDNAEAAGFCVECVEWLCRTCVEAHQRVKFTKDHTVRLKDDTADGLLGLSGQRPVLCPVHKQEQLKLFCETCDRLTCRDCQLLEHKEHRYQFLEEAFQNQKTIIETFMAKLQEKRNYVQIAANQVQNRLNEVQESKRKVEHDIKVAIYTLMNEINKKGKALLQQLEALTGERQSRLQAQHGEVMLLSRQVDHVMNFAHWALTAHSNFALLYSKRLIFFQLRRVLRAPCDPTPALSGGVVRFYCDPNFWARNVLNLGTLVMENPVTGPGRDATQSYMTNQSAGSMAPPTTEGGAGSGGAGSGAQQGQINLAQLRLQHMQHRLSRLAASIRQPSSQHAPQRPLTSVHMVNQQPIILQYHSAQPPRLVTLPPSSRGPPCGSLPNPLQQLQQFSTGSIPGGSAAPHSSQQGVPPQLMRQHSAGVGGPGPTGGSHLSMGISSIPSVTNPENLPTVPDIPPIQLDEFGGMLLLRDGPPPVHLSHGATAAPPAHLSSPGSSSQSPHPPSVQSPNLGALHLHGAVNSTSHMAPVRPSSASSNGSRASAMGDPLDHISIVKVEQVYVKQEPGTTASHGNACRHSSPPPPPPPPQQQSHSSGRSRTAGGTTKMITTKVRIKPEGSTPSKRRSCMLGSRGSSLTPPTSNPGSAEGAGGVTSGSTGRGGTGGGGEANASADDDDPNEDWCGVCQNGGDLLCCERCPKVFHLSCHVPALLSFPTGEWLCAFCRSVGNPEMEYDSEDQQHGLDGKRKTPLLPSPGLSGPDQRKCERLLLHLFCHELSAAFHEPVSHSVPSYYKTIRKPMDLSTIKLKLQKKHMDHYHTPAEFVSDVRLIFKNCAKFNEPDSEVGRAGLSVLSFFEETLSRLYPQLCVPTTPASVFGTDGPPTSSASSSALTTTAAPPSPPPLPPSLLWLSSSPPLPLPPTPLRSASSSSSSPPRPSSVPSPNPASAASSVPTFAAAVPPGGGGPGGKKKGGRRKLNNNDDDYHDDGEIETSDEDFEPRRKKRAGRGDEKPVHIR